MCPEDDIIRFGGDTDPCLRMVQKTCHGMHLLSIQDSKILAEVFARKTRRHGEHNRRESWPVVGISVISQVWVLIGHLIPRPGFCFSPPAVWNLAHETDTMTAKVETRELHPSSWNFFASDSLREIWKRLSLSYGMPHLQRVFIAVAVVSCILAAATNKVEEQNQWLAAVRVSRFDLCQVSNIHGFDDLQIHSLGESQALSGVSTMTLKFFFFLHCRTSARHCQSTTGISNKKATTKNHNKANQQSQHPHTSQAPGQAEKPGRNKRAPLSPSTVLFRHVVILHVVHVQMSAISISAPGYSGESLTSGRRRRLSWYVKIARCLPAFSSKYHVPC